MPSSEEGVEVRPGMCVRPGMTVVLAQGKDGVVMLHVEHSTGSTVLPMSPEYAQTVVEQLLAAITAAGSPGAARPRLIVPEPVVPRNIR